MEFSDSSSRCINLNVKCLDSVSQVNVSDLKHLSGSKIIFFFFEYYFQYKLIIFSSNSTLFFVKKENDNIINFYITFLLHSQIRNHLENLLKK